MAKFKLKLEKLPTFKFTVPFVMPNGEDAEIVFDGKHIKVSELQAMSENEVSDIDFVKAVVEGWDLEEEFNDKNIGELLDLFPGVAFALGQEYRKALIGYRAKN